MNKDTDPLVHRLNASLAFDIRLFNEDIDCSLAWVRALNLAGVLDQAECAAIDDGLEKIRRQFEHAKFSPASTDEDIHTAVERTLTELIGPVASKLQTGRSRNDQVSTDFRLWVVRACARLDETLLDLA